MTTPRTHPRPKIRRLLAELDSVERTVAFHKAARRLALQMEQEYEAERHERERFEFETEADRIREEMLLNGYDPDAHHARETSDV